MRDSFEWNYRSAVSLDRVPGEQVHILHFTSDVVQLSLQVHMWCSTQEYYVSVIVCLSYTRTFRLMQTALLEFETLRCLHQVQNVSEKSAHWQDKQVISDFHFPYNWVGSRSKLPFVNGTIIEDCPLYRCLRTQDVYQRLLLFPPKTFSWQQTHY